MHAGDAITWKSTLMKMREDDVVSSSVITRYSITPHGSACHVAARGGEKGEARGGGREGEHGVARRGRGHLRVDEMQRWDEMG